MSKAIPVLMYHHVSPSPGLVTVSPETFEAQMAYLAGNSYQALSADGFLACLTAHDQPPRHSVLITFDDGFLDNYVYVYPILKRHGLRAVIFAVTGWVSEGPVRSHAGEAGATLPATPDHKACKAAIREGRPDEVMLRWSEIQKMEEEGVVEVQSHTHNHIRWDEEYPQYLERLDVLRSDLVESMDAIKSRLHHPTRHLCWPWGRMENGYQEVAQKLGFEAQYTTQKGINKAGTDPHHVARIVVKDLAGNWFANRMRIFSRPLIGGIYTRLRGE